MLKNGVSLTVPFDRTLECLPHVSGGCYFNHLFSSHWLFLCRMLLLDALSKCYWMHYPNASGHIDVSSICKVILVYTFVLSLSMLHKMMLWFDIVFIFSFHVIFLGKWVSPINNFIFLFLVYKDLRQFEHLLSDILEACRCFRFWNTFIHLMRYFEDGAQIWTWGVCVECDFICF